MPRRCAVITSPTARREGRYWLVGDVIEHAGPLPLFVRLTGPESGMGAAGKWTEYVAPRVMLRPRRLVAVLQTIPGFYAT